MKTLHKVRTLSVLALLCAASFSCEDILEEDPKGLLSQKTFWNNDQNAIGAVNSAYSAPLERGNREHTWNFHFESAAQDFRNWDLNFGTGIVNGTWNSNSFHFIDCWRNNYAPISRANFVLSNLPTATINPDLKSRLEGEARFVRANYYFNLVRAFGDVPLILKQSESTDDFLVKRTPTQEVYQSIIDDLEIAVKQLPLKSTYNADDVGRASKGAAQGLLAKVHLTLGDYEKARTLTQQVIDSKEYSLQPNFIDIFKAENDNGSEWLFSYQSMGSQPPNNHITGAWTFPPIAGTDGFAATFGNIVVSLEAVALYDKADIRLTDMIWNQYTTNAGKVIKFTKGTGYFSKKYYDTDFSKNLLFTRVNYPILRYSDILLMNAEATNEISPMSAAVFEKLNMVRQRARTKPLTTAEVAGKAAMLDEIMNERRREFLNENQRFWDLKRRGKFLEYVRQFGHSLHQDNMNLFPIPQIEMDANPNLVQNPGY